MLTNYKLLVKEVLSATYLSLLCCGYYRLRSYICLYYIRISRVSRIHVSILNAKVNTVVAHLSYRYLLSSIKCLISWEKQCISVYIYRLTEKCIIQPHKCTLIEISSMDIITLKLFNGICLSPSRYLCTFLLLRRLTGKNYTELVQNKRLTQAAYLLETTGLSVADIGERVGYENMSYFHRIFKERYGISPKKYRVEKKIQ